MRQVRREPFEADGLRLKLLLVAHGVRQSDLVAATGASPSAVSRWLRGDRSVPSEAQAAIEQLLRDRPAFGRGAQ